MGEGGGPCRGCGNLAQQGLTSGAGCLAGEEGTGSTPTPATSQSTRNKPNKRWARTVLENYDTSLRDIRKDITKWRDSVHGLEESMPNIFKKL